jgi:hypothetical protein
MTFVSRFSLPVVLGLAIVGGARVLCAQSLADVAKQEEHRRGAVKAPAKVLTNKDLNPVPVIADTSAPTPGQGEVVPSPPSGTNATAAPATPAEKAAPAPAPAPAATPDPKDQAYWSNQQKALQTQLSRDQTFMDAMQTRINSLTADFTNRDDPAQRALISADRQKAVDELARLKDAIEKDKKAIADFGEQARREGVPPGWLR